MKKLLPILALALASHSSASFTPSQDAGAELTLECDCKAEFSVRAFAPYSAIAMVTATNRQCTDGTYIDDTSDEEPPALAEGCDNGEGCQLAGTVTFTDSTPFGAAISSGIPSAMGCADFDIIEGPGVGNSLAGVMAVKCGSCAPLGG